MRYGVGGFCHWCVQSARGGGLSALLRGLGEHVTGLRRAEGLEGQAALGHAVARELPGDGRHEFFRAAEEVHHLRKSRRVDGVSEFSAPCSQTTGREPAWTDASMDKVGVMPTPPEISDANLTMNGWL